jgi:hypothetical protein
MSGAGVAPKDEMAERDRVMRKISLYPNQD